LNPRIDELPDRVEVRETSRLPKEFLVMSGANPIELAAEMIAALVSNNPLPKGELPALIHTVHATITRLAAGPETLRHQPEAQAPAVPVRRSITPDFLICLDDGKRFKSLRRHLAGHGLTPEQYREKWNLPSD
jgi:predicted transcriptional regulator